METGEVEEVGGACPVNYFRCENGPCIPEEYRCNGRVDCPYDVSDELDCSISKLTCLLLISSLTEIKYKHITRMMRNNNNINNNAKQSKI